jgi:hypothetical protein
MVTHPCDTWMTQSGGRPQCELKTTSGTQGVHDAIHVEDTVELSLPREITQANTETLEAESLEIAEESNAQTWFKIKEILQRMARERFFNRVIAKLPSTLQANAYWASALKRNIRDHHIN